MTHPRPNTIEVIRVLKQNGAPKNAGSASFVQKSSKIAASTPHSVCHDTQPHFPSLPDTLLFCRNTVRATCSIIVTYHTEVFAMTIAEPKRRSSRLQLLQQAFAKNHPDGETTTAAASNESTRSVLLESNNMDQIGSFSVSISERRKMCVRAAPTNRNDETTTPAAPASASKRPKKKRGVTRKPAVAATADPKKRKFKGASKRKKRAKGNASATFDETGSAILRMHTGTCGPWTTIYSRPPESTNERFVYNFLLGGQLRIYANLLKTNQQEAVTKELMQCSNFRQYSIHNSPEPRTHFLLHENATDDFDGEAQPGYRYASIRMKAQPLGALPYVHMLSKQVETMCQRDHEDKVTDDSCYWNIGVNPVLYRDGRDNTPTTTKAKKSYSQFWSVLR
jgi:hypothetical protein